MEEYISRVLISREDLGKRVAELGAEITRDYEGKKILVLGDFKRGGSLYGRSHP